MIKYFHLTHRWDPTTTPGQSGPGSNERVLQLFIEWLLYLRYKTEMMRVEKELEVNQCKLTQKDVQKVKN